MSETIYSRLSFEGRTLLDEAYGRLRACYDPACGYVYVEESGKKQVSVRESLYYALALMIRGEKNSWAEIEKITRAVIALQIDMPEEIYHGVFRHAPDEPMPPRGRLNYRKLGLYGRYWADCAHEQITETFHQKLLNDPALSGHIAAIEHLLDEAVIENVPVVWRAYEPNLREFALMCFAMLLEHGKTEMPVSLLASIQKSALSAMEGAVTRSKTNFTPLNTNIQCMHVFLLDYFGRALNRPGWREYAVEYARQMLERYREHHACAEFNSPTYYGVDLSTLGFVRRYSDQTELIALTEELEAGIWRDAAEFYNPAMRNFCGPYSRAYEMEMGIHTCFCDMLYWALGEKQFPWHPFSTESGGNPLMLLGDIRIPPDARAAFLTPKQDAVLFHRFRELSERGDPENNSALCAATGWITPELMIGALSGSENPSYQLHPLVVFWRQGEGLGTIKLLRCLPDGQMTHLHTVLFDGRADRGHVAMDIDVRVRRDVDIFFEIECGGLEKAAFTETSWRLPGLTVSLNSDAPKPVFQPLGPRVRRIVYPARIAVPETMRLRFELQFEKE